MSIQYVSILIEALAAVLGLVIYFKKKRFCGLGFFVTFGIYVYYDLARLFEWNVSELVLYVMFFIASVSALVSIWEVYRR